MQIMLLELWLLLQTIQKMHQKDKNFFTADMATMTKALGNELDAWKRK